MGDFKLVTAGDDIKIWDINGYSLVNQYNPHAGAVNSVVWSQDNNFVASAGSTGDKVVITNVKNNNAHTITELAQGEDRTCVAFNTNSRYVLSGGKTGTIAVWDLKTQKLKKTYKNHKGPINSVTFNWNDTYIASGSETGDIIIYNVVTAQGSAPMSTPKTQAIRQLQYSHFKKALVGAVSDDGAVSLWDTNTRRLLHSFTDMHCASATGLAFSPLNEILLMSVGLDKRIICYDVIGKTAVKTMTTDSALTCVDFHQDGATLAVGSMRGKVYIYDLRQKAQPVTQFQAHQSAVSSLRFQNNSKYLKNDSSSSSKSHRITMSRKGSTSSSLNYNSTDSSTNNSPRIILANGDSLLPTNTPTNQIRGLSDRTNIDDVISPCRDYSTNQTAEFTDISSENKPDVLGKSPLVNACTSSMSMDGVFSPLNNNSSNFYRQSIGDSVLGFLDNGGSSPPGLQLENGHKSPPTIEVHSPSVREPDSTPAPPAPTPTPIHPHALKSSFSRNSSLQVARSVPQSPRSQEDTALTSDQKTQRSSSLGNIKKDIFDKVVEKVKSTPQVSSRKSSPLVSEDSRPVSSSSSSSRGATIPPTPVDRGDEAANGYQPADEAGATAMAPLPSFQTEFIRNIIEDAMEDFRDQMRRDVFNLQVEMLRQFQIQQGWTQALIQQNSVNPQLVAEVERLREEVKRLKKHF